MAPRKPSCKGCCVLQKDCQSCARCLPRYLCVDVVVTPGPYTDIHCCDPDGYGHGYFSFRMTQSCGAWSGSGTCTGLNTGLAIGITLNADCNTVLTTNLDAESFVFAGVLPASMSGTSFNDDGDQFDWSVSSCSVVENPRISDRCSPCTCTTCLPRKLCITYSGQGESDAISMEWDCSNRWIATSLPAGVSATAVLKAADSGVCGIDIDIETDIGGYSGTILLEGPLHSRKIHGTICKDTELLLSTLGVPELIPCPPGEACDDPPPQTWNSFISETVSLSDAYGNVTGSAIIRDQSCGDCVVPACEPEVTSPCCSNPLPRRLHATVNGVIVAVNYGNTNPYAPGPAWFGTLSLLGYDGVTIYIYCVNSGPSGNNWFCKVTFPPPPSPNGCIPLPSFGSEVLGTVCDPLDIVFLTQHPTNVCTGGSETINVELTV